MALSEDLTGFVRDALARGASKADIDAVLREAGWEPRQVQAALRGFADVVFPVPVPRPRQSVSARDAFLYLLLFSTLYLTAYHVGSAIFDVIELVVPDPVDAARQEQYRRASLRWSMSSLLVAFPVFVFMSRATSRAARHVPGHRSSTVKRWLTYLTLFLTSAVLIGDVIALIYRLLGGELTLIFSLKAVTIAIIGLVVLTYYLVELRDDGADGAEA
jgi:hypothetical protein